MASKPKPGAGKKAAPKPPVKKAAAKPSKAAGPVKKPAAKAPARPVAKPAPTKPAPAAKPAAPVRAAAPVAKAPIKGKAVPAGKAAVPPKGTATKSAVPAKGAAAKAAKPAIAVPVRPIGKIKLVPAPAPSVRPIGVLPPEAMARTPNKTPRPAGPARPVAARPGAPARPGKESMSDQRLSDADLKHFETRLLQERARIMKEMGHLESTVLKVNPRDSAGELSGYSFHMADAGTDSMEREKAFDIASKEGRLLMEIDAALGRLYRGEYGVCEASGKPISRARLEALPWARYTVEEQEKLEREQRAGRAPQPE